MPITIQRHPVGVIGALDLRAGGDAPTAILEDVRGTFELSSYYLGRVRRSRTANILVAANVLGVNVPNPTTQDHMYVRDGEIWVIRALTAELSNITGTCNGMAGFVAGAQFYMNGVLNANATAGGNGADGGLLNGLLLFPGDSPAFFFRNFIAATNTCDIKLNVLFDLIKT